MKYYARVRNYIEGGTLEDRQPYFTIGKWYEIVKFMENAGFIAINDLGCEIYCLKNNCDHLGGGDWEILSEDEIDAMVDELWETVDQ